MDDDDYIVSVDSFNNKGYKGDDDFETWMKYEAPFVDDSTTGTFATTNPNKAHNLSTSTFTVFRHRYGGVCAVSQ